MGLETTTKLVCDRCGASEPAQTETMASFELAERHPGWHAVDGKHLLCPDCAPGYELLLARHKVELDDYIRGHDVLEQ